MKYINFKYFLDKLLALLMLTVLFPLFLIITIILKLSSIKQAFFVQERLGHNCKPFKLIKFKSMNDKTDANGKLLPDAKRITPLGTFLRKSSLDELPQVINILKGDMSLIGPRPLFVRYEPYYTEREQLRHTVRPGITGYAQVNGRNTINWDERLELDAQYVENLSFKNDILIFWQTVKSVLFRKDIVIIPGEMFTTLDNYRKNATDKG